MREIHSERKVTFAIISIIFLSGIFFGLNFTNTSSNLIKTPQTDDNELVSELYTSEGKKEINLFQNYDMKENESMQELFILALEKINIDRKEHGLTPVLLGNNMAAQNHVDDMMKSKYFSHWNTNGVKPYVTYTQHDGRAYVKENIAASWCEGFTCKMNPSELIEKFQYLMVYDDADSNWGHRDNILDPNHALVNIGIAWDNNNFYYAQHFETKIIDFEKINYSNDKVLRLAGKIQDNYTLKSITIFQDPLPLSLDRDELESNSPYNQNFYNSGIFGGILVNEPQLFEFYEECANGKIPISSNNQELCIPYETFGKINENNSFEIAVDVASLVDDDRINTIYINLENQNGDRVIATSITLEYI